MADTVLAAAWLRLVEPLGWPPAAAERLGDDLRSRWSEPLRAYHGQAHLRHVLATLDMLLASGERAEDPTALRLAAWFHDAVYEPGSVSNEADSAALARRELSRLGMEPQRVEHIATLVLATRDHEAGTGDQRLLVDADLAILASDPDAYDLYRRSVRVEYADVSPEHWRAGRTLFLQGMLERPAIYATATLRARGEQRARDNMRAELTMLS